MAAHHQLVYEFKGTAARRNPFYISLVRSSGRGTGITVIGRALRNIGSRRTDGGGNGESHSHSLTHSFTHSLIHSLTHSLTHTHHSQSAQHTSHITAHEEQRRSRRGKSLFLQEDSFAAGPPGLRQEESAEAAEPESEPESGSEPRGHRGATSGDSSISSSSRGLLVLLVLVVVPLALALALVCVSPRTCDQDQAVRCELSSYL
jgi:hypothetical protein